jgi:hypothetical protein
MANKPAYADEYRVGGPIVHRTDLNAEETEPFVDVGQIRHIATKPIQRFDYDDIKRALS